MSIGIPTTRVSDMFVRQRMLGQVQSDQLAMFKLQVQLSTGYRIQLPSENPGAASRIVSLQRLLERKDQVQINLSTNQSYLTATDTALSTVSNMLAEVRSVALGALDTTVTDIQRQATCHEVEQAIQQLLDAGNQKFRGRYLFAGRKTDVQPFESVDPNYVRYCGDSGHLQSYSDIDLLFDTNLNGNEVFGAISEPVLGSANLEPVLTFNTRLSELRGGLGISPGSISITGGNQTSTIDLSNAETIGDVALMIRNNPPEGKQLNIEITATGLTIELLGDPGDLMTIREVGGTTADELGILTEIGTALSVVGDDLDPVVQPTTQLDDILGTRSSVVVRSDGSDNDIIFEAETLGAEFDGIEIIFLDDGSVVTPGVDEQATYDPVARTLTVTVKTDHTQACHVVAAVMDAYDAGTSPITARLDPLDEQNGGQGVITVPAPGDPAGITAGGNETPFDKDSGLQIVNAGQTHVINLSNAETIEDIINILNTSNVGVTAEINDDATGINIRSLISGGDFMIGENGGTTATQLGLRTFTESTRLEDIDYGAGLAEAEGTDFTITTSNGDVIEIDVSDMTNIGEVLTEINDNAPAGLVAQLADLGNGIELVDDCGGPGTLTVERTFGSLAAVRLGLVAPDGQDGGPEVQIDGGTQTLTGLDTNPQETEGVFTALSRLTDALEANDVLQVERAIEMLDQCMTNLTFARAELGSRQQGLDIMQTRMVSEEIDLKTAISDDYDADLAEVISNLTARQLAYEASLQATANIFQLTLLNYL